MEEKEHVRFFACIGNPPYQDDSDKSTRKRPLYDSMMDACFNIADKVEFITPARFLFDAGQTPKDWNQKMLADPHFKVLEYNADSTDVFRGVDIKGGVVVTYRDDTHTYEPIGTFIPFDELRSIASKVMSVTDITLDTVITSRGCYRMSKLAFEEHPELLELQAGGTGNMITSNSFTNLYDVIIFSEQQNDGYEYVKLLGINEKQRMYRYIRADYLNPPDSFYKYKVFVPKSNGSGALGEVLSTPLIGAPLIGATDTFISIGCFDTEDEAQACMKYIKTKFARAMLGILKVTQDNPASKWRYVPLQDFTSSSDIDWSQSVADIDQQLYAKYGLSDDEIAFIEEKVKAMD